MLLILCLLFTDFKALEKVQKLVVKYFLHVSHNVALHLLVKVKATYRGGKGGVD